MTSSSKYSTWPTAGSNVVWGGLGDPPRLLRDGSVVWHGRPWDADQVGAVLG
ncbi:hypothetical protein ACFQO7_23730 [Catellatospora aurea]|uniref:Uncharacterized protein n=1 Tax=Catellatospora aurea TaxID=1337874 RepID=A0ABW2H3B1_9ACTN